MFSKTKIMVYGLLSGVVVLLAFLAVFIHRSDVAITMNNLNLDIILSPVVYESIFNQISFVKMLAFLKCTNGTFCTAKSYYRYIYIFITITR